MWLAGCALLVAGANSHAAELADLQFDYRYNAPTSALSGLRASGDGLLLAADATQGVYYSKALRAPLDFTAVGPHWMAQTPDGTSFEFALSTSADGRQWSDYHPITADPHMQPRQFMPDGSPNPSYGDTVGHLIHRSRGDGRFVRFRLTFSRDSIAAPPPSLQRLTLSFIDSRVPGPLAESGPDTDGSSSQLRGGGFPKPPVNSRVAWGAAPPNCTYAYCNVTHLAVHHTAGQGEYACNGFDECATDVRAIQAFHMNTNGWCDVGYNYLASSDGQLWEGRGGGDDVRGAHDGFNCGSMGVANMGYYHPPYNQEWTEAQLDAVAELATWKADQKGIDPEGFGFYEGLGANMDNIYGHRDVSSTACPGDTLYPRLGELRSRVVEKLSGGSQSLVFDNPAAQILIGPWNTGTSSVDKFGSDYYWANTGGGQYCVWRVGIDAPGDYEIAFWWPQGSNRNPQTRLLVKQGGPIQWFTVNQQTDGGQWNPLGQFSLSPGTLLVGVSNSGASGDVVMCDAVRLTPLAN